MPTACIGLDLGTKTIKLVELLARPRRIEVTAYAQADMPNLLLKTDQATEDVVQKTTDTIMRMMEEAQTSADTLVVAIPTSVTFSTVVALPDMPDEEMESAIKKIAYDTIPSEQSETSIIWSKQQTGPGVTPKRNGQSTVRERERVTVVITALPHEILDRYQRVVNELPVEQGEIELEAFPLVRATVEGKRNPTLLCDIGSKTTTLYIVENGAIIMVHTIDQGGEQITQAISRNADISLEEAQQLKHELVGSQTLAPSIQSSIQEALDPILRRARLLSERYAQKHHRRIGTAILTGGGAATQGIEQQWRAALNQQALRANPWQGLSFTPELGIKINTLGPTYAAAVGCARRIVQ